MLLAKEVGFYESEFGENDWKEIGRIKKEISALIQKQQTNNELSSNSSFSLKTVSRRKSKNSVFIHETDEQIKTIKLLLETEYYKIEWGKIKQAKSACVNTNVQSHDLRKLLNDIVRMNFDLEKSIIQKIHKAYEIAIIDNNVLKASHLITKLKL